MPSENQMKCRTVSIANTTVFKGLYDKEHTTEPSFLSKPVEGQADFV